MTPTTAVTEFPKLLDLALAEAQEGTRELVSKYQLDQIANVRLNLALGSLIFGDEASFDVQVVGSFDAASGFWRWAWGDPNVPRSLGLAAAHAKAFGKANEIVALTNSPNVATEADGWRWTAFAARLIEWPAIYRLPLDTGPLLFLAFRPTVPLSETGLIAPPRPQS